MTHSIDLYCKSINWSLYKWRLDIFAKKVGYHFLEKSWYHHILMAGRPGGRNLIKSYRCVLMIALLCDHVHLKCLFYKSTTWNLINSYSLIVFTKQALGVHWTCIITCFLSFYILPTYWNLIGLFICNAWAPCNS